MIEKNIEYFYGDTNSSILELIHPGSLEKTAQLSDELDDFIKHLPEDKDCSYVLCNALSAGEYYGSNRNGDYFPEEVLKKYHKTFEALGYVYRLHQNKDPRTAIGKVVYSHYNDNMHRVELVLKLDNKLAKVELEKLKGKDRPATSMGAKVPFDQCSICGNRAKTRKEYCAHLTTQLNQILPDGRKVYAINTMPKFFDLSIVFVPADKTSSLLRVVNGSGKALENSIEKAASFNDFEKVAELINTAEMDKQITGDTSKVIVAKNPDQLSKILALIRNDIKPKTIEKLAEYPLNETLSTFLVLRIMPTPEDFQKLALYSLGNKELADELERNNIVFDLDESLSTDMDDVSPEFFNEKIASEIEDEIPDLSITKDWLVTRGLSKMAQMLPNGEQANIDPTINSTIPYQTNIHSEYPLQSSAQPSFLEKLIFTTEAKPKMSAVKNPIIPLSILGVLFGGYVKLFGNQSNSKLIQYVRKNPLIIPGAVLAGSALSVYAQENALRKEAGLVSNSLRNAFVTIPASYYYAGRAENKARSGKEISQIENFVRKHPLLTAIATSLVGAKAEKEIRKIATFVSQIPDDKKDIILEDLIGG